MISKHTYLILLIIASFFIHSCANYNGLSGGGLIKKTDQTEEKNISFNKLTASYEDEIETASVLSPVHSRNEIIDEKLSNPIDSDKVSDCLSNDIMDLSPKMSQLIEQSNETEEELINEPTTETLSIIALSLQLFAVIAMAGLVTIVSILNLPLEIVFGGLIGMGVFFLVATVLSFISKFRSDNNSHLYKKRWLAGLAMLLGFIFLSLIILAIFITYLFLMA